MTTPPTGNSIIPRAHPAFTLLELCAALALGALIGAVLWTGYTYCTQAQRVQHAKLQCAAIAASLESFRVDHASYPAHLSELVSSSAKAYLDVVSVRLDTQSFRDPWGRSWEYASGTNKRSELYYTLRSCGPDGILSTDTVTSTDDINAFPNVS